MPHGCTRSSLIRHQAAQSGLHSQHLRSVVQSVDASCSQLTSSPSNSQGRPAPDVFVQLHTLIIIVVFVIIIIVTIIIIIIITIIISFLLLSSLGCLRGLGPRHPDASQATWRDERQHPSYTQLALLVTLTRAHTHTQPTTLPEGAPWTASACKTIPVMHSWL